jgi:hypothetical protein
MPLTPATLTVNFTANYKGIHRICWRVQGSGDEYDCSLLTSCAGNGATCSFNIPIVVDNEDCGTPVIYEGYIQPICNDITSEDGRLPFEIGYYPEDCPDDPCFNAPNFNCIIYSGDPILCGAEVVINTGDNLTTALTSLSDRICDIVTPPIWLMSFNQEAINNPTHIDLINTTGETITWERTGVGSYRSNVLTGTYYVVGNVSSGFAGRGIPMIEFNGVTFSLGALIAFYFQAGRFYLSVTDFNTGVLSLKEYSSILNIGALTLPLIYRID